MLNLSMPLGYHIRNEMRNMHAKFHEFGMHRNKDMNLSLFSFPKFCTLDKQELRRFEYMKSVVLDEAVPTKFNLYFSGLYFIFYEFSNFMNGKSVQKHYNDSSSLPKTEDTKQLGGINFLGAERERKIGGGSRNGRGRAHRGSGAHHRRRAARPLGLRLPAGKQSSSNGCSSIFVPARENGTRAVLVGANGGDARLQRCGRVGSEAWDYWDSSSDSRLLGSTREVAASVANTTGDRHFSVAHSRRN
jgi:hypothetical protein